MKTKPLNLLVKHQLDVWWSQGHPGDTGQELTAIKLLIDDEFTFSPNFSTSSALTFLSVNVSRSAVAKIAFTCSLTSAVDLSDAIAVTETKDKLKFELLISFDASPRL